MFYDIDLENSYIEGYYDAMNEQIQILIGAKKEKKKKTKEIIRRYNAYKKKRIKQGKEVLSLDEWITAQEDARELRHEMAKAGIKIAGTLGVGAAGLAIKKATKKAGVNQKTPRKETNVRVGNFFSANIKQGEGEK